MQGGLQLGSTPLSIIWYSPYSSRMRNLLLLDAPLQLCIVGKGQLFAMTLLDEWSGGEGRSIEVPEQCSPIIHWSGYDDWAPRILCISSIECKSVDPTEGGQVLPLSASIITT